MRQMKNSGVEWLGEIPEEWKLIRTKNIFRSIKRIVGDSHSETERLALTLNGVVKRNKFEAEGLQPEKFDTYQFLYKNELVFKLIDLGNIATSRVGLSQFDGMVSPAYIILHNEWLDNRFYLYYFLSMWYGRIFNSLGDNGVRSSLNANDLLNLPIVSTTEKEKIKIADFLEDKCTKIDSLIAYEEAMLEELKAYKQSVITEAVTKGLDKSVPMKDSGVELMGQIPNIWSVSKIKRISKFNDTVDYLSFDTISYTPMECVGRGVLQLKEIAVKNISSGLTAYKEGDILMAKVTPCFENGNIAIASNLLNGVGVGSSELFTFTPLNVNTRWLFYFLQNDKFKSKATATMTGTGGLKRVSPQFVKDYFLALPPKEEQQKIADYLDKKCANIDNFIFIKQQKIEELKEYKKSLIYEYVTGKKEVV